MVEYSEIQKRQLIDSDHCLIFSRPHMDHEILASQAAPGVLSKFLTTTRSPI